MRQTGLPDFFGKVVYMMTSLPGHYWVLAESRFENQAGIWVLVGKPIHHESFWADGATVGVPWKSVLYYAVFDSPSHYFARRRSPDAPATPPPQGTPRGGPG